MGSPEKDIRRLRRRAHAATLDAAQRLGGDLEPVARCFCRYDWRRGGAIGPAAFARAAMAAGFAFTRTELASLAACFGDGERVAYSQFLAWATPDDAAAAAALLVPSGAATAYGSGSHGAYGGGHSGYGGGDDEGEEAMLKLRGAISRSALDAARLRDAFERLNVSRGGGRGSGSRTVPAGDLPDLMHRLGLPATPADVRGLLRRYGGACGDGGRADAFYYEDLLTDLR
ncbi:unnamed protein product, partial [Phaeothamnion confervicola]